MKPLFVQAFILSTLCIISKSCFADVPPPSDIGKTYSSPAVSPTYASPHAIWIGKKFLLMHFQSDSGLGISDYADMSLRSDPSKQTINADLEIEASSGTTFLKGDKFAGKIITCTGTKSGLIVFHEPTFNVDIYAKPDDDGTVSNIAPFREIDIARKRWLGKTVYGRELLSSFHRVSATGGSVDTSTALSIDAPLKIIDITWGIDWKNPIWVICKTNEGEKGFYAITADLLNKPVDGQDIHGWNTMFFDRKPTLIYHCSQDQLDDAFSGQVDIGMSKDVVTLAIGKPKSINTDIYNDGRHEQWVYDGKLVYFDGDTCSAIQTMPQISNP